MTDRPDPRLVLALHAIACDEPGCSGPDRSTTHSDFYHARAADLAATPPMAELLADAEGGRAMRDAEVAWSYSVEYDRRDGADAYWATFAPLSHGQPKREGSGPTIQAAIEAALGR